MKTVYRRQTFIGLTGDIQTLEQHFSLMAEKGWMIDKIGMYTHRYRAIDPCKKTFFVDLFPNLSAYDYPENERVQRYRSTCEESGWTFITANRQIQVFCAQDEAQQPLPIHTENSAQADAYKKACLKYELPFFILCLPIFYFLFPISKGIELFLSDLSFFLTIGWFFFMVAYLWSLGFMISWFRRILKSVKHDLPMPTVNYRLSRVRIGVFAQCCYIFLFCLCIGVILEIAGGMPARLLLAFAFPVAGFIIGILIRWQINTRKRERGQNIRLAVISIVVLAVATYIITSLLLVPGIPWSDHSLDNRPVMTLADFGAASAPESSNAIVRGSVAVPVNYSYWEISSQGSVDTQVYRSISKSLARGLYDWLAKNIQGNSPTEMTYFEPDEAAFWGADKGVAVFSGSSDNKLLLMRGTTILIIDYSLNSTLPDLDAAAQAASKLWGV